jgi:hypothetical protein
MGASPALLEAYEALPFARKVIFTDHATALPHGFHLHCYNRPEVTGGISMKYPRHSLHRWYEEFDMAAFLNDGTVQASRWGKRLRKKITTQGEHK